MPSSSPLTSIALGRSGGVQHRATAVPDLGSATVVIPCYRYGRYLPAAVAAALDQPGLHVQVIIVDDCSPDDSADIADQIASTDSRVSVIRHRSNLGHIATYNDGLKAATGSLVALVSADDLVAPGALSRSAALLHTFPDVGFCYGRALHFSGEPPTPRSQVAGWITWPGRSWIAARCRAGYNVIASPEVLMRRSVMQEIGGYRSDLPHSGDLEMWMRAASVADVGFIRGPDQALYRQHGSNMHTDVFLSGRVEGQLLDLQHRWAAFDAVLTTGSSRLAAPDELRRTVQQAISREAMEIVARAQARGRCDPGFDRIEDFSRTLWPEVRTSVLHRNLGSTRARRAWFFGSAAVARLQSRADWWRLEHVGV